MTFFIQVIIYNAFSRFISALRQNRGNKIHHGAFSVRSRYMYKSQLLLRIAKPAQQFPHIFKTRNTAVLSAFLRISQRLLIIHLPSPPLPLPSYLPSCGRPSFVPPARGSPALSVLRRLCMCVPIQPQKRGVSKCPVSPEFCQRGRTPRMRF